MSSSWTKVDGRQMLYESTPRPGKPKLQVVLQRRPVPRITLEKGNNSGDPWLKVHIKQVAKFSHLLMQAFQILFEYRRHEEDPDDLPFPIQLGVLRRRFGPSSSIVQELRVSVDKWEGHPYVNLIVFQQEGETWVATSQRITLGFAELERVHAALNRALQMTRNDLRSPKIQPSVGSRFDETPSLSSVKGC